MKTIQSKMKALQCSQRQKKRFFRRSRAAYSVVGDRIWQKFKLIQAFMVVLVACKNDEDPFKTEGLRVLITLLLISLWESFMTFRGS